MQRHDVRNERHDGVHLRLVVIVLVLGAAALDGIAAWRIGNDRPQSTQSSHRDWPCEEVRTLIALRHQITNSTLPSFESEGMEQSRRNERRSSRPAWA